MRYVNNVVNEIIAILSMTILDFLKISTYNIYVISKGDIYIYDKND